MSLGQVVDTILQGEVFYRNDNKVVLITDGSGVFIENSQAYLDLGLM